MKNMPVKVKTLFIALAFGVALTATIPVKAAPENVTSTAGGLKTALKTQIANAALSTVTSLTVTGTIDARDFRFIRDSLSHITALDLGNCSIAAYSGTEGTNIQEQGMQFGSAGSLYVNTNYAADAIPGYALYLYCKLTTGGVFVTRTMPNLTSLTLPQSTVSIGKKALGGLSMEILNLSNLTALTSTESQIFTSAKFKKVIFPTTSTFTNMGTKPFENCSNVDTVTIPASITAIAIGNNFFEGCKNLQSVIFEETCQLTTLPGRMFAGSNVDVSPNNLLYVKLPASVISNDVAATFEGFLGNFIDVDPANPVYKSVSGVLYKKSDNTIITLPKGLETFDIPSTMTVIPAELFMDMVKLKNVTGGDNIIEIGNSAFENTAITSFNFTSKLEKIGKAAFKNSKLKSVDLSNCTSLKTIVSANLSDADGVFQNIDSLTTVNISGLTFTSIGMFSGNSNLTAINLGSALKKIATGTFKLCTGLTTIDIPASVDSIMEEAFSACKSLTTVNLSTGLMHIGGFAFGETPITEMNIPASCVSIGFRQYLGTPFTNSTININVAEGNPVYSSKNGMLLNKKGNILIHTPNSATPGKALVIPEGVDTVLDRAFYTNNDANVNKITLPATLKLVQDYGLYGVNKVETIISNASTPPALLGDSPLGVPSPNNIKMIIVPTGAKTAYLAAKGWKNYHDSLYVMTGTFTKFESGRAHSVSPNGKYAGGLQQEKGFIYNVETGSRTIIDSSTEVRDVNNSGHAAITYYDSHNYYKFTNEEKAKDSMPLLNGGVYRDGKLYSLGLGRAGFLPEGNNAPIVTAMSIDEAGSVYGSTYGYHTVKQVIPFAWKHNITNDNYTTDTFAFASPQQPEDQGSCIFSVSKDGQSAGGWISRDIYGGGRTAIIWPRPDTFLILNENDKTAVGGVHVSPSGKYFVFQYNKKAAIYDKEKNKLSIFGPEKSHPTAVSSNGFVVGYCDNDQAGRVAFIWSEKLGYKTFKEFFAEHLPLMEIPQDDFLKFDGYLWDVPQGISEDGLTIAGWSGASADYATGWIIQIPKELDLIDRPHDLTGTVNLPKRNTVNLSWTSPESSSHRLTWYYIYRNGEYIGRVDVEATGGQTTYADNNAPAGLVSYQVSAVYDYTAPTAPYLESALSDPKEFTIVDDYNLPFTENFERKNFSYNYWTTEASALSYWTIYENAFNGVNGALFLGAGNSVKYSNSLTSKPLNAVSKETVILAFTHFIAAQEFFGIPDTLSIEVREVLEGSNNNPWIKVKQIVINETFGWTAATVDLSEAAADKLFQVRFRASGSNRVAYNYAIDNIGIGFEKSGTPEGVIAYSFGEQPIKVMYKDATGSYGLSYGTTGSTGTTYVGNGGNPIIAANRFTSKELIKMRGKYLTSVSAYLFPDAANTETPTVLKLAVFVNNERVESSTITAWKGFEWNNFPLSAPVEITGQMDEIYVGIELVSSEPENMPISMGTEPYDTATKTAIVNPDGNYYSEDGGNTWENADATIEGGNFGGHWDIVANIRDEAGAATPDDDIYALRYELYRNETLVGKLLYGQMYTDKEGTKDDCYTVKIFSTVGGMSQVSQEGCVEIIDGSSIAPLLPAEEIIVYPNPTSAIVTVVADVKATRIYDMQGKLAAHSSTSSVDMRSLPNGTYLLEITTKEGNVVTKKVIKK